MEKTITVEKLIEGYKELSNDATRSAYLKGAVKTVEYMTAPAVDMIATQIVNVSSFDKDGNLNIDSFKRYFMFMIALIDSYTNIEIDSNNATVEYDNLKENGLLDVIVEKIPEDCIETLQTAINMKVDDLMNNYQMKRYDKIAYIPESLIFGISEILKKYSEVLNNVDWNELLKQSDKIISD